MPKIVVYSSDHCPYCTRAKALLDKKGVAYQEIRIDLDPTAKEQMMALTQRRTVPQIFIGDLHVGGCDDLYTLEREGKLTDLLQQP